MGTGEMNICPTTTRGNTGTQLGILNNTKGRHERDGYAKRSLQKPWEARFLGDKDWEREAVD